MVNVAASLHFDGKYEHFVYGSSWYVLEKVVFEAVWWVNDLPSYRNLKGNDGVTSKHKLIGEKKLITLILIVRLGKYSVYHHECDVSMFSFTVLLFIFSGYNTGFDPYTPQSELIALLNTTDKL